jgi:hypothetical protein
MPPTRIAKISLLCALMWLCAFTSAWAREYHGMVTFGGLPVPGATVTATQGAKKLTAVTDQGGLYHFDDLADGQWTIEVEMQCFQIIHEQVTVSADTQAGKWELALQPVDQLMARTKVVKNPILPQPVLSASSSEKKAGQSAAVDIPKAPESSNDQSADGYLVNGSVNNAATSRYSTNAAFGNTRSGSRGLYNGGFAAIFDSSVTDARPYTITGSEAAKSTYDHITNNLYLGGPIKIPHLLPRGPTFFVNYEWTRNNTAAIIPGLVPTAAERAGDFSGLVNALGAPITIYNPFTGQPYANNQISPGNLPGDLSPQAAALLALYPLPNPNVSAASGYNYQAPVLNGVHQDALQSRLDKTLGRKDQLNGGFNFQSTRADSVNLFNFVDTTDTLGLRGNIQWNHRVSQRLFLYTGYTFSRLRTQVRPNFANRENISGNANIAGNDPDASDWGPPALSFSSGIIPLSDANSAFNRSQTDGVSVSVGIYRGRHNISAGGDFRKQDYNDDFQENPRGAFSFTGAATANPSATASIGSDMADFLAGVPDTSAIAYGNADKYLREPVYDAFFTDDWRILPILTINAGMRYEYSAPMTELHGRLANLDLNSGFTAGVPVLGNDPVGPVTGAHYPTSLVRPDRRGIEPRIGISWRPIPASTIVVHGSYGIYRDTSVYQSLVLQMAQQAPFSTSFSVQNNLACLQNSASCAVPSSSTCPLTLANGFDCASTDTFAIDPNYRIGYAQIWQTSVQRDLPAAMQMVVTYSGVKGTHGAQQFLPNTYPPTDSANPCPDCPIGFVYRASGGNSTRQAGQIQLRRRLKNGFTASLQYTYSKSIDDDAALGGQGYVTTSTQNQNAISPPASSPTAAIAQNWRDLRAERALSAFDQRHLLNLTAQYTSGEGLGGGTLMSGWRGRAFKEWTLLGTMTAGTGLPETPIYFATVPGTGYTNVIRPSLTGASINNASGPAHINASAYEAPAAGEWGTAGRDSITGPSQFTLNSSLMRTFRPHGKTYLDLTVNATNLLNHPALTNWDTVWNSASESNQQQFGRPLGAGGMRTLQTTIRLRF